MASVSAIILFVFGLSFTSGSCIKIEPIENVATSSKAPRYIRSRHPSLSSSSGLEVTRPYVQNRGTHLLRSVAESFPIRGQQSQLTSGQQNSNINRANGANRFIAENKRFANCHCSSNLSNVGKTEDQAKLQLQAYVSGIEAITGSFQELDEIVEKLSKRSSSSSSGELLKLNLEKTQNKTSIENKPLCLNDEYSSFSQIRQNDDDNLRDSSTEFLDDPIVENSGRRTRDSANQNGNGNDFFGLPTTPIRTTTVNPLVEDLTKASHDLESLRKQLSTTAEWLKRTNHTAHSVMLRALQAYVASVERRVKHQRTLHTNFDGAEMIGRIALIRERMDLLIERLRDMSPVVRRNSASRVDHGANANIKPIALHSENNHVSRGLSSPALSTITSTISPI